MERKTILAVVLASVVLIVSFVLQSYYVTKQQQRAEENQQQELQGLTALNTDEDLDIARSTQPEPIQPEFSQAPVYNETHIATPDYQPYTELETSQIPHEYITIDTELYTVVLSNSGGDIVSYKWKDKRKNAKTPYVDLILPAMELPANNLKRPNEARALSVILHNTDRPITDNFRVDRISDYSVVFYRDFSSPNAVEGTDGRFSLIKRYDFLPDEYMFKLTVSLDGRTSVPEFKFNVPLRLKNDKDYKDNERPENIEHAYTLSFGPQIGPDFDKLDNIYDYRHYDTFKNGKRKGAKVGVIIDNQPSWAAVSGKYFTFIAMPLLQYNLAFSDRSEPGFFYKNDREKEKETSRFYLIRPAAKSRIDDVYYFYLGPKTAEALSIYNLGSRNEFGIRDAGVNEMAGLRGILGILSPLVKLLNWMLELLYGVVGNYGVSIILLTFIIKLAFFPLTKKGSEATLRMQALAPKIKEIQEKHKGNPQKLQAEMAVFYKQEGYNPISGCLPMLLQLPIFLAMYQMFNNHFDLRGAGFFPVWITDLSVPEYIYQFESFEVPFLGWTAIRVLPFIYVGSQLLYGKVTQMPGQQSNTQMKMMLYVMPIVFFFILYDVPSGLLIYWIFSNILTLVQQLVINKFVIAKKKAQAEAKALSEPPPKTIPGKKKKKNN